MRYLPAEFPLEPGIRYLNHAAVAPWPKRTAEAVQRFAFENMTRGAARYPDWMAVEQNLRERLAWLINAPCSEDIALVKNTSEGLSFVATGIDWHAGDRIIGIADDFPSNRVVWESLADRGVAFDQVDINAEADPEQALIDRITGDTRLMAVSSVHFATGLRMDLARLSAACRETNVLLCVDAIQSLGAVRFDLDTVPADFVIADGHKWMLAPEGLGLFYVNPAIRDELQLTEFGWAMRAQAGDYAPGDWRPSPLPAVSNAAAPTCSGYMRWMPACHCCRRWDSRLSSVCCRTISIICGNGCAPFPACRSSPPKPDPNGPAFSRSALPATIANESTGH